MTKRLHPDTDQRLVGRPKPYVAPASKAQVEKWRTLGFRFDGAPLSEIEDLLLQAWGNLSPDADKRRDLIDSKQLLDDMVEKGGADARSEEWLRKKTSVLLRELSDAGVLARERVYNGAAGVAWAYHLRSPEQTASLLANRDPQVELSKSARRRVEALHEVLVANTLIRPGMDTEEPWSYLLVTQLMERCSRPKQSDPRTFLSSSIVVDGEIVTTEASATLWGVSEPTYGIVVADDAQLILALLTTAMQKITRDIEAGVTPKNQISVDLLQIAKQLHSGNERSTFQSFQRSMARIANSEFRLCTEPGGKFASRISDTIGATADTIQFRLLSQVFEGKDERIVDMTNGDWGPSKGIRYVTFSLTPLIWEDLLIGRGWVVHPGLLYERSGMTHKIYNHLKAHSSEEQPYSVTGDHLMRYIHHAGEGVAKESRKAGRFCSQLWRIFSEHATRSTGYLGVAGNPEDQHHPLSFQFFDLDVHVEPLDDHMHAILIEAKHSRESKLLRERQEHVTRSNLHRLKDISGNHAPMLRRAPEGRMIERSSGA